MKLRGAHVVVIGGTSGMGLAIAKAAIGHGARVMIGGSSRERLDKVAVELGEGARARPVDIANERSLDQFFSDIQTIDHLVVTAHPASRVGKVLAPLATIEMAQARVFFDVKFWGAVSSCQHALDHLAPQGSITLFSGAASRRVISGHTVLGAINGALESFARQLSKEIAPRRVNVIAPGLIRTPAYDSMPQALRDAMFEDRGKVLPVGRVGCPEDIADAAIFAMTNGYLTGATIDVDGGGGLG